MKNMPTIKLIFSRNFMVLPHIMGQILQKSVKKAAKMTTWAVPGHSSVPSSQGMPFHRLHEWVFAG
jgi:hypothetical protein